MRALEVSPRPLPSLTTEVLGRSFANPLWLASGSLDETVEKVDKFLATSIGAVIPRTTRWEYAPGRERHPSPHLDIAHRTGAMRNAEWTGYPIAYWRPYLERLAASGRVIMSVSGRDIEGCAQVCQEMDSFGFPLFEINISCAHSNEAHGFITRNQEHIKGVVGAIKEAGVKTPIALKLGHSDFIVPLAQAAEEAGADAIVAINAYGPVLDFDIETGKPELTLGIAGGKGGLSGRPIFNITLTDVAELSRHLHIPVIASGGVASSEDIIKLLMAGASAVEIYTAAHLRGANAPAFLNRLVTETAVWLQAHGYNKVQEIQGMVLPKLTQNTQMQPLVPRLVAEKCTGCRLCDIICNEPGAIRMIADTPTPLNRKGEIPQITDSCIGCGACVTECPPDALTIDWPGADADQGATPAST